MDNDPLALEDEPLQPRSENNGYQAVILHEKLGKRKIDRYMINFALACEKIGYDVTILTSQFEAEDLIKEYKFSDKISVLHSGWWIPNSLIGFFQETCSAWKAICMAIRLIICAPFSNIEIVILDVNLWALYLLKCFTRYKIYYVESFTDLKYIDACYEHTKVLLPLLKAKWIKLADEIIVETEGFGEILMKSHPSLTKKPVVLYPSIDIGLWNEPIISIKRIIPDLMEGTMIFLTIGKFNRSSNFKLALEAFEILLNSVENPTQTKRLQLVIAGTCRTLEEKFHYRELKAVMKDRPCGSQITFLKQLPTIHEKTLIKESVIMIHPAKNDVYSDFILKAMSLKKPIIATNKGIASKILVHKLSGLIMNPDPGVFAAAMSKLVSSHHMQVFLGDMAKDTFNKNYSLICFSDRLKSVIKNMPCSQSTLNY